jgi:hypothetical protein
MYLMRLVAGDTNIQAKKWAAEAAGYDEQIWRPDRALHEILQQTTAARKMADVEAFIKERHKEMNSVSTNQYSSASKFLPQVAGEGNKLKKDKAASSPTFARGTFFKQGGSKAPTADELSLFLRGPLQKQYPEKLMTRFQLFVKTPRDEHAKDPRVPIHEILNTIPYWAVSSVAASGASLATEQEQSRLYLVRRQEYAWSARALVCGSLWGHCALCENH